MAQSIRVLIADDNARAREGLCALLTTGLGVEVVGEASNGREALDLIAERRPEVVLMDVQMPVMDGLQATRLIKNRWPEVTIIVLTMHATQQTAARAAGADDFVVKGSPPQRLFTALGAVEVAGDHRI